MSSIDAFIFSRPSLSGVRSTRPTFKKSLQTDVRVEASPLPLNYNVQNVPDPKQYDLAQYTALQ